MMTKEALIEKVGKKTIKGGGNKKFVENPRFFWRVLREKKKGNFF